MSFMHFDPAQQILEAGRAAYLRDVAVAFRPTTDTDVVVVTHVIPDRPAFLHGLSAAATVRAIVALPWSTDLPTLKWLRSNGMLVHTPNMRELGDPRFMYEVTSVHITKSQRNVALLDMGGFLASSVDELGTSENLLGIVEDTESGHRAYAAHADLPVPVLSAARSVLKHPEDRLIGSSLAFSVERCLRLMGQQLVGRQILVLGFGRIGASCADAFAGRGSRVSVFDTDPIRLVDAISAGYETSDRGSLLSKADVIVGATGRSSLDAQDIQRLRDGTLLASVSSGDNEFGDITLLPRSELLPGVARIDSPNGSVLLLAEGSPANFLDGAVVGSVLSLVQAEMIASIGHLASGSVGRGLSELPFGDKRLLAEMWVQRFVHRSTSLTEN